MIVGKRKTYSYSMQGSQNQGIYIECWQGGKGFFVRIRGEMGVSLEMENPYFEELAVLHLRQQGYVIMTPEEKISGFAMAHMAGLMNEQGEWKGNK